MKKHSIIILILIITCICIAIYSHHEIEKAKNKYKSYVIGNPCPTCYKDSCGTFPTMDLELAAQLVRLYREHHWRIINKYSPPFKDYDFGTDASVSDTVIDSRCAWYRLKDLKLFIKTIESNCCRESCEVNPELGIRIYYGEYPAEPSLLAAYGYNDDVMRKQYAGLHTLLMIPTYFDPITKLDVDFDPPFYGPCTGSSIFDTLPREPLDITKPLYALLPSNISSRNHGGLTPPPFRATDYWTTTGALFMEYSDRTDRTSKNLDVRRRTTQNVENNSPFDLANWPPVR